MGLQQRSALQFCLVGFYQGGKKNKVWGCSNARGPTILFFGWGCSNARGPTFFFAFTNGAIEKDPSGRICFSKSHMGCSVLTLSQIFHMFRGPLETYTRHVSETHAGNWLHPTAPRRTSRVLESQYPGGSPKERAWDALSPPENPPSLSMPKSAVGNGVKESR